MIGDMDINSIIEENRKLKKLKEEFNNISLDRLIRETEAIREMARQRDQAQETCRKLNRKVQKLESQLAKMTKKLQKAQSKGAKQIEKLKRVAEAAGAAYDYHGMAVSHPDPALQWSETYYIPLA